MSNGPVYLASDAHLGATSPEREKAFLEWLRHAGEHAAQIVINGDLFDFWFEYRGGVTAGYDHVLALLKELTSSGVPVTLMGGNHDWWGGAYLREEIGVEFLQDPVVRDLGGLRTFLAHGDGLGAGDLGYRALKLLLRGRFTRFAFGSLPPVVGDRVARVVSLTEHRWGPPTEADRGRSRALESWAAEKLRADRELDLVVLGHAHIPVLREVEPDRWYVNAGDWVYHRTYLVLDDGDRPRLLTWGA